METLLRLHVKDIEHYEVASVHENDVPADGKVSIPWRGRRQTPFEFHRTRNHLLA
jgi:hypothetical protein